MTMVDPHLVNDILLGVFTCASIYGVAEAYMNFDILRTQMRYKLKKISTEEYVEKLSKVRFPFFAKLLAKEGISSLQKYGPNQV